MTYEWSSYGDILELHYQKWRCSYSRLIWYTNKNRMQTVIQKLPQLIWKIVTYELCLYAYKYRFQLVHFLFRQIMSRPTLCKTLFLPCTSISQCIWPSRRSVHSVTLHPLEGFSSNLAQQFTTLRRSAECMSHWLWCRLNVTAWAQRSHNHILFSIICGGDKYIWIYNNHIVLITGITRVLTDKMCWLS